MTNLISNYQKENFTEFDDKFFDFRDMFQSPLQPLRDNLESKTYEYFEEDSTKYEVYYQAMVLAFKNFKKYGAINLDNIKKIIADKSKSPSINGERVLICCVLGAGRGPLVRKLVKASRAENVKIRCILLEKNLNAYNTLLNLKTYEPEIFKDVEMNFGDIRDWNPDFKIDMIISELLGSFGDNELSPECLLPVEK